MGDFEEFNVMVKIDGEETSVNIQDLVKGYATDQSLSNKGRELSEARKELEAERQGKLEELDQMGEPLQQYLVKQSKDWLSNITIWRRKSKRLVMKAIPSSYLN